VKPSLVFLRPDQTLSEYEMNYVRLLDDEFDLHVLTSGNAAIGGRPANVTRLSWPDEFAWGVRRRSLINAVYCRLVRRRYHMPGLERALQGARVVQALEAASECSYQAARLKDRLGFKLCLSVSENQPFLSLRRPHEIDRALYVLDRVDHAFAIPSHAAERLVEAGLSRDRITVTGHGVDCERFAPVERPAGTSIRIGYCGRFRAEKGLDILLKAARGLDIACVLLGDGPDRPLLEALAGPRTSFLPPLPYSEIHTFYRSIDVFVLPSIPLPGLVEQFGFVLLEAMASGVPIIATQIGGIPEVVGDAAVLIPSRDIFALQKAIQALANDPARRQELAARGRQRALQHFRRELVADKMRQVYRRLLG